MPYADKDKQREWERLHGAGYRARHQVGNIQIIPFKENCAKARRPNVA